MRYNKTKSEERDDYWSDPDAIRNDEGSLAYRPTSPKLSLFKQVATMMMGEDKFYKRSGDVIEELNKTLDKVLAEDPNFIARLAIVARHYFNLRTVPLYLVTYLANANPCNRPEHLYKAIAKVISRADELTEILAIQKHFFMHDKFRIPQPIKKGVALAFNKFNAYQLAKYNVKREFTLKDAINLCHPKPKNDEQSELFRKILDGELKTSKLAMEQQTWETYISMHGSNKESWEKILPQMPIFAFIRNLRNFVKHNVDFTKQLEKFNADYIEKSKLLPFRFYAAWKALENMEYEDCVNYRLLNAALDFLENAIDTAVFNVPLLNIAKTVVLVDLSSSMEHYISKGSFIKYIDLAALFGAVLAKQGAVVVPFSTEYKFIYPSVFRKLSVCEATEKILRSIPSWATDAYKPIQHMNENKLHFDRMIILSDGDVWASDIDDDAAFQRQINLYRRNVNSNLRIYMFDLTGYNHMMLKEDKKTILLAGWTERIFELINTLEMEPNAVLKLVNDPYYDYKDYRV